jgi:hypothetical protein
MKMGIEGWPWKLSEQVPADVPLTIRELVGRPLRVVKFGDVVTQEYIPGRVTIYLSERGLVADVAVEVGKAGE